MNSTANQLAKLREYLGLTISGFAEKAGLSQPFVSQIEKGVRNVGRDTAGRLCSVFGVSTEWLMSGEGNKWSAASPEALRVIQERGNVGWDELAYLAERIDQGWETPSGIATPAWVVRTAEAIGLLLPLARNRGELENYLRSTLPPGIPTVPVDDRPAYIKEKVLKTNDSFGWGSYTAKCLVALIRDGAYDELPRETISALADLMLPWAFWVARRSFADKTEIGEPFVIETKYLDEPKPETQRDPVDIRMGKVALRGYISSEGRNFALSFPTRPTILFSSEDLLAFVNCLGEPPARWPEEETRAGHWSFIGGKHYLLQFKFVLLSVEDCYDQLMKVKQSVLRDDDLIRRLTHDYVDKYGAV
ncbi:MAG: helix-turn-helix domain-containing protein [Candidatus Nitrospinota bacterium M3_3B_026]